MGLVTNEEEFNNPFQVADSIRNEMIRQAEETGRRALDWDLASFDKVGGENTLRRVWASLNGDSRVRGRKREAEESDTDSDNSNKKLKISLNISSACERIGSILLYTKEYNEMEASKCTVSRCEYTSDGMSEENGPRKIQGN